MIKIRKDEIILGGVILAGFAVTLIASQAASRAGAMQEIHPLFFVITGVLSAISSVLITRAVEWCSSRYNR